MLHYLAAAAVIFLLVAGWALLVNRYGDHQRPYLCTGRRNGACCSGLPPEECPEPCETLSRASPKRGNHEHRRP